MRDQRFTAGRLQFGRHDDGPDRHRGRVSKDWFLGVNISGNCSEKLDNTFQWSNR